MASSILPGFTFITHVLIVLAIGPLQLIGLANEHAVKQPRGQHIFAGIAQKCPSFSRGYGDRLIREGEAAG